MARTISIRQIQTGLKKVQALALQRRKARLKVYEQYKTKNIVLPNIAILKNAVIKKRQDDLKKINDNNVDNKTNKFNNITPLRSGLQSVKVIAEKSKTISDAITPKKVRMKNSIRIRMMAPQHTL
ncbi:MAG: hypothetical protein BWY78_00337 [Alphaproteobacteria bacterium ADurb.Bin438]|nr:MAG: hypothetical protein BWY78_00337 [Alphaproteobacteria bacterium ADurb.Bin438]